MKQTTYTLRHLLRITLEAATPLAVGSGRKSVKTDSVVARDANGLPYIPATSLAGVLRHALDASLGEDAVKQLFGYQGRHSDDGQGSRLLLTDALLFNEDDVPADGLCMTKSAFLQQYAELPIRQHARINGRGTVSNTGKFDNQVVFRGSRFVFEMEIVASENEAETVNQLIHALCHPAFRIGASGTCGYGAVKVVEAKTATLDLTQPADLDAYLVKPSSLAESWAAWKSLALPTPTAAGWVEYTLSLQPRDFYLFGSGFGDDEADMTPVSERVVEWTNGHAALSSLQTLVPATSVKGALAHRTAYHYNRIKQFFADQSEDFEELEKKRNEAVAALFGEAGDRKADNDGTVQPGRRGNTLFEDLYLTKADEKLLNHVAIDKFTGGVMDGALFTEKTTIGRGQTRVEHIYVRREALADRDVRAAFEQALHDLTDGLLPLGGGVNRGHGIFTGTLTIKD